MEIILRGSGTNKVQKWVNMDCVRSLIQRTLVLKDVSRTSLSKNLRKASSLNFNSLLLCVLFLFSPSVVSDSLQPHGLQ